MSRLLLAGTLAALAGVALLFARARSASAAIEADSPALRVGRSGAFAPAPKTPTLGW
jgi:hypothetical protein